MTKHTPKQIPNGADPRGDRRGVQRAAKSRPVPGLAQLRHTTSVLTWRDSAIPRALRVGDVHPAWVLRVSAHDGRFSRCTAAVEGVGDPPFQVPHRFAAPGEGLGMAHRAKVTGLTWRGASAVTRWDRRVRSGRGGQSS